MTSTVFVAIARAMEMEYNETLDESKLPASKDTAGGRKRYSILLVSDGTGKVRTLKTTSGGILLGILLCAALVILIIASVSACVAYSVHVKKDYEAKIESLENEIETLTEDKIILEADLEARDQELSDLTKKLSEKETRAQVKTEEENLLFVPSALPLDSQALPSEYDKEKKWITIEAAPGTHVVAAGSGTVDYAGENAESGGYLVTLDHGNGYKSDYYCQSRPVVKKGKTVDRGTALFAIGNDGDRLFYRIRYEGEYIDPYTVLNIAG